jgi:nucleoside-diphosphate-sugar epimerase
LNILITGAAGNLGSQLARHLIPSPHELRLLFHRSALPSDLVGRRNVSVCRADLGCPATLERVCQGVDCIVHLAGVLFAPLPERFLPLTNVGYVKNLTRSALASGVRKFILVSFPHVEGNTTPDNPALGRLDRTPDPIHFRTRLEAENYLLNVCEGSGMIPVVFRAGVVYGNKIKLVERARWMLQHRLLAVWRKPTWVHLIALPDFLTALQAAIENENVSGIYQICDDQPLTLQEFLNRMAEHYGYPAPWRLPGWMFQVAAVTAELASLIFRSATLLNRDILKAGMTSSVAYTKRMKCELLPVLAYPTLREGIKLL